MKKHIVLFAAALILLTIVGCARSIEKHTVPYDSALDTLDDGDGADAFAGSLDHPDSAYYVIKDYYNTKSGGSLHILPHFKTYQQTTEYTCGCACALMVLDYYGENSCNEMDICERAGTDDETGTSVEGLVEFFESMGYKTDYNADVEPRFETIEDFEGYVIESLDKGVPIMVDWVDWRGHWQVIIGIDTVGTEDPYDDVLIMADSYDITDHYQDGYYTVPFGRFFDMWREGVCAQKTEPYEQPFVAAYK